MKSVLKQENQNSPDSIEFKKINTNIISNHHHPPTKYLSERKDELIIHHKKYMDTEQGLSHRRSDAENESLQDFDPDKSNRRNSSQTFALR